MNRKELLNMLLKALYAFHPVTLVDLGMLGAHMETLRDPLLDVCGPELTRALQELWEVMDDAGREHQESGTDLTSIEQRDLRILADRLIACAQHERDEE